MYSIPATDDDDLFVPSVSSNLAALFNNPNAQFIPDKSHDLSYSAPRQPKLPTKSNDNNPTPAIPIVLCAKVVQVYKFINKQYALQGKYGFALSGIAATKTYEIIIYKDKQNVLQRMKINPEFRFILQPNNFASFFDDSKQNWSVYFETSKDLNDITHQLEIIGVKVVPIEEKTLPDIKKDLELKPTELPLDIVAESSAASTNAGSESEQVPSIQSTRESILNRMAKMGQSTLMPKAHLKPKLPSEDISDSETDSSENVKRKPRKLFPKPSLEKSAAHDNAQPQTFILVNGKYVPAQKNSYEFSKNSSLVSYEPPPMQQTHNFVNDPMQMLLSENRTLNSEMRMHLFRLTNKLEDSQNSKSSDANPDDSQIKRIDKKLDAITRLLEDSKGTTNSGGGGDFHALEIKSYKNRIKELEELVSSQNKQMQQFDNNESSAALNEIKQMLLKQSEAKSSLQTSTSVECLHSEENTRRYKESVKKIMNAMYKDLNDSFENSAAYQTDMKTVLASKIVDTTYKIIESFDSNFENQNVVNDSVHMETTQPNN